MYDVCKYEGHLEKFLIRIEDRFDFYVGKRPGSHLFGFGMR